MEKQKTWQIKYLLPIHVHKNILFFLFYPTGSEYLRLFNLSPHADGWEHF